MAARSLALLRSLRILVQHKHTSTQANAELLLSAASLPVLVSTFVKQQASVCAEALFGCYLYKKLPTSPNSSQETAKLTPYGDWKVP